MKSIIALLITVSSVSALAESSITCIDTEGKRYASTLEDENVQGLYDCGGLEEGRVSIADVKVKGNKISYRIYDGPNDDYLGSYLVPRCK